MLWGCVGVLICLFMGLVVLRKDVLDYLFE